MPLTDAPTWRPDWVPSDGRGRCATASHETLDPLADASRYRLLARPTAPVTAAFLVKRDRTEEFVRQAVALDARIEEAELTCTGPWPAYSFVGGDEA